MYKNSLKKVWIPLIISSLVAMGVLLGIMIGSRNSGAVNGISSSSMPKVDFRDKISYTMTLIDRFYVDPVNRDSIAEKILPLILKELDPHSIYIPAKNMQQANETLDGEFDGIGVVFNMTTDTIVVIQVVPGGPSEKAGLNNGDRIIKINDSTVVGKKIDQNNVVKMLRGKRGTTVNLSLERQGLSELVPISVERGVIPIKSLDAAFMIAPKIGVVKLSAFSRKSYTELIKAFKELKEQGMESLIFDLRGNGGGFLDQAISIANEFLPKDRLIVYTKNKQSVVAKEYSDGHGKCSDIELVILIDEFSASSSEILAGAIQDNDRGIIIGRRSFGKGLVQQAIPYYDGSSVRLTIAKYYTPTGRSIQKSYDNGDSDAYNNDILSRYKHSEFFVSDSIKFDDSLKFITPKGKVVYGGGGIMPDIFIPLDTTTVEVTKYFREVTGRNILYRYTLDYSDKHRDALNNIASVTELNELLDSDKKLLDNFVTFAQKNGVEPNYKQIEKSRNLMETYIRAYIGRNSKIEDAGFYSNLYKIDDAMNRAIEELSDKE